MITALALVAGAVFYLQATSPASMLSAIRRVEIDALNVDRVRVKPGQNRATWDDVYNAVNAELRRHSALTAHDVVSRLMQLASDANSAAGLSAPSAAFSHLRSDPDNLAARLAAACVADAAAEAAAAPGDRPAIERFDAMRRVIETTPPAERATLHNRPFVETWRRVLQPYLVARPDVRDSWAESMAPYLVAAHHAALPVMQKQLAALSDALRTDNHVQEADACLRWFARMAVGIIVSEPDAPTRLLCVDVLARCFDPVSDEATRLRRLRSDFHAHAAAAPIDRADQSPSTRFALDPAAYRAAFDRLVIAVVLVVVGLGSAAVVVMSTAGGLVASRRPAADASSGAEPRRAWWARTLFAAVPSGVLVWLTLRATSPRGVHSEFWLVALFALSAGVGALTAVCLATLRLRAGQALRLRAVVPVMLLVLAIVSVALPPVSITKTCRLIHDSLDIRIALAGLVGAAVVFAMLASPARLRVIAAAAARVALLNAALALLCYQLHRSADHRYQQSVAQCRFDEFAARLGTDWQDKYLAPARRAFGLDAP